MAETDTDITDKVELALRGLGGICTIAEFLNMKFHTDVEIEPASSGLSVLADDARDRLEEVAEDLHDHRPDARTRPDPHIEWQARHAEIFDDDPALSEAEVNALVNEAIGGIEVQMASTPAMTTAGIAAQVRCVLTGLRAQHGKDGDAPQTRNWIGILTRVAESLEARP